MRDLPTIAAVILGSDQFPFLPSVFSKDAFRNSAVALKEYFESKDGLGIGREGLLNLFGCNGSVEEHDTKISEFLSRRSADNVILLVYVGHGGFLKDRDYFLTLKNTKLGREHVTALRMRDLAATFINMAAGKQVIVILDCCFSGSAVDHWQAFDIGRTIRDKTFESFPVSGTAILVAASRNDPAVTLDGADFTMFSGALLETFTTGIPSKGSLLTLREVGDHAAVLIKNKFGMEGVIPEVHSPRQINDDVASVRLFPNPACDRKRDDRFTEMSPDQWTAPPPGSIRARIARMFDDKE